MACFTGRAFSRASLEAIAAESYAGFDHPATAPLIQLGPNLWLQELFHGPTLAFKDFALQMVARLLDAALRKRGRTATILAATSGDTGAAAIEAFRGRDAVSVVVLHPAGRVSEMQRRQMTCRRGAQHPQRRYRRHLRRLPGAGEGALRGPGAPRRDRASPRSTRSTGRASPRRRPITSMRRWPSARRAARSPSSCRRATSATSMPATPRRQMGVPIERLVVATNRNDILARFFETGRYRKGTGAADAEPQHGHSGREQLRAPCSPICATATAPPCAR